MPNRARRSLLRVLFLAVPLVLFHRFDVSAVVPPPYEGELGVCNGLERELALGAGVATAFEKLLRGFGADDVDRLGSIHRTAVKNAIVLCRHPPEDVLAGAVRAGVPIEVIVAGALDAGLTVFQTRNHLLAAGVAPAVLAAAVSESRRYAGDAGPLLPSGVELHGGLGGPLVQPPTSQFVP